MRSEPSLRGLSLGGAMLVAACAAGCGTPAPPNPARSSTSAAASVEPTAAPPGPASGSAASSPTPLAGSGAPAADALPTALGLLGSCGELGCLRFDTPEHAFDFVLASRPLVLAVGETHAQKGSEAGASTTKRFTDQLLPMLRERASDLVLELWVADGSCGQQEKQVAKQQAPVTQKQAATNTNEFVVLRDRAVALGLAPHVLRPSCAEYDRISKAGEDAVSEMLSMITRLTVRTVTARLEANTQQQRDKIVLAYGGAMHNDLAPPPERAQWSFGGELQRTTNGRYVELDLIVPELVRDTDSWKALPWYRYYRADAFPRDVLLYRPQPGAFVLIFPKSG